MPVALFDTVWINGSVGAGKTTTAVHLGEELRRRGIPGAVIDVDWLRRSWPAPPEDPFRNQVALANVRAVAKNFRGLGAQVIVVAGVVETPEDLAQGTHATWAASTLHVRLTIDREVALSRLRSRHGENDAGLEWHSQRHPELAQVLDRAGFEGEMVIDVTSLMVGSVAGEIANRLLDDA